MEPFETNKKIKSRRLWTIAEEKKFIELLKVLVTEGWKSDNGFRPGFGRELEKRMLEAFPGTSIRANPHINSKLHGWKKEYGSLVTCLAKSGIGWNHTTMMLDIENETSWEEFAKADVNARLMRNKTFPYYEDWLEIFGKDRATGEGAQDVIDANNELPNNDNRPPSPRPSPRNGGFINLEDEGGDEVGDTSVCQPPNSSATKRSRDKKRKLNDGVSSCIVQALSSFLVDTRSTFGAIVERVDYQQDAKVSRREIYQSIKQISGLTMQQKLTAADELVRCTERLDLFLGLDETERSAYVKMLLDKLPASSSQ